MQKDKFKGCGTFADTEKWDDSINRNNSLYQKADDIRSEFYRDYNRILHSKAYSRLKHKTQVFPATTNDHICTRIEHVSHVASVSYIICKQLGLNTELSNAIALGHDLGHTPFGHDGEKILNEISKKYLNTGFWHERNSLFFIDKIETLPDNHGKENNLALTYAVRDGIISHCGEVNENAIFPRKKNISLDDFDKPNKYQPFTWEGCVVKIADKISYLGRDIEDALKLNLLTNEQMQFFEKQINFKIDKINNTVLMHDFIINLCEMSSPEEGIKFSDDNLQLINNVKNFNFKHIYKHKRLTYFNKYIRLIIESIFEILIELYCGNKTSSKLKAINNIYPSLAESFSEWLVKYSNINLPERDKLNYNNQLVYDINLKDDYLKSIIEYISSMTDNFAIGVFNEITKF